MKTYGEVEVQLHHSSPRELDGELHGPAVLLTGKKAIGTHWTGGCVGPRAGLEAVENRKILLSQESNPGRLTQSPSLCGLRYLDS
jgi:hypothetical protein